MNLIEYLKSDRPVRIKQVRIPEWGKFGNEVYVKQLPSSAFASIQADEDAAKDVMGKMIVSVVASVCDKDGTLCFSKDDISTLLDEPIGVLIRLATAAKEINGLSDDDIESVAGN
jgi:hypothetical protein